MKWGFIPAGPTSHVGTHQPNNIIQRCGPLEYNSGMLGARSEYEFLYIIVFQTSQYYTLRAHKMRVEC